MSEKSVAQTQHANCVPSNSIFVKQKPVMSYVAAIILHLNSGSKEVILKAPGRAISNAVDIVEVAFDRFTSWSHVV